MLLPVLVILLCTPALPAQQTSTAGLDQQTAQALLKRIDQLEAKLKESDARLSESETRIRELEANSAKNSAVARISISPQLVSLREPAMEPRTTQTDPVPVGTSQLGLAEKASAGSVGAASIEDPQEPVDRELEHTMDLPGGPKLNIRGFLDFNLGLGTAANPLIYPLTNPPTPVHNTFQFGEFDLFMRSELSNSISFLSEVVIGSDANNFWGVDIERAQITYKASDYFQLSGGRMHSAIGYYNTAYHHGTWFQTTTGRPYMYLFEDSGGILPVHIVGIEAAGLLPASGKLNAHWIFQVGNGESSLFIGQPIAAQPVQNFLSDKNHKAFNIAGYIKPDWARGLQIGVNYYYDERVPDGVPHVKNSIAGAYLIYVTPTWEFLNEFQVQRDHSIGATVTYNTPLGYTQFSRKFGKYRPYFRWQEVNVPANDPLYGSVGRYESPSLGLRMDFTGYAALKVQYNRIYSRDPMPKNGVDSQVAFTF
jgi:hypothetical protein